jgi:hypothetical protein
MVYLVGMNAVSGMERISSSMETSNSQRFVAYRMVLRLSSVGAALGLAVWLWRSRGG